MFYKKAMSYFMPNRLMPWNVQGVCGNPTKSGIVNELIKAVTAQETAGQGMPSLARRDFQREEFEQVQEICKTNNDMNIRYGVACLLKFAYHLIARLDDSCKLMSKNLRWNPRYDFSLKVKLQWSKNVRDERNCPWQIILGAADADWCMLLALCLALETSISMHGSREFVFNFGKQTHEAANSYVSKTLREELLGSELFDRLLEGLLGTHSCRKFSTTLARSKGGSKDECDYRARWKGKKRQQDAYTSVDLPWPDGKVAGLLCIGGPIKYYVNLKCCVTKAWILQHVVPNISDQFDSRVAEVLGTALLWATFDSDASANVPIQIQERIHTAYTDEIRGTLQENENPVQKIPLVLFEVEGVLHIEEAEILETEEHGRGTGTVAAGRNHRDTQLISGLYARVNELQRTTNSMKHEITGTRAETKEGFRQVNRSLNRICNQAGRRVIEGAQARRIDMTAQNIPADRIRDNNARLCRGPKTLHQLWDEWANGIGGMKASRLFTAAERGRVRHLYSKRKIFWDKICEMVRAGYLAEVAIDKVYDAYGDGESVTYILRQMQKDKRARGGHPELRVV
jgi:hypothetical protein